MKTIFNKNLETGELTSIRFIPATIEKVWDAWTKPSLFEQWWGPRGWTTTVKEFKLKPGGHILYGMKCVDESQGEWFGKESWGKMIFEAINPKHEFTYTDYFCDENGVIDESMPSTNMKMQFEAVEDGTKLINTGSYESGEDLQKVLEMGMEQGLNETLDRLEEIVTDNRSE